MKSLFFILILSICSSMLFSKEALAQSQKDYSAEFRQHRNHIMGVHVGRLLTERLRHPEKCKSGSAQKFADEFKYLNPLPDTERETAALVDLYWRSYNVDDQCKEALAYQEGRIPRWERKFFFPLEGVALSICAESPYPDPTCMVNISGLIADFDPHCPGREGGTMTGHSEKPACYAADRMTAVVTRRGDPQQNKIQAFNDDLSSAIKNASPGDIVDIWDLYKATNGDSVDERERFLAILTLDLSSDTSEASHVDGFKEYYFKEALFSTGYATFALEQYHLLSARRDRFTTLKDWAYQKKVKLRLRGLVVHSLSDHDYMAAFLGCHYRDASKAVWSYLPQLMGYSYKTIDSILNLKGAGFSSWKVDVKTYNTWKTDVNRYKTGTQWGHDFCTGKFN